MKAIMPSDARITAVHLSPGHTMSKQRRVEVRLIRDHGVEGDAHAGSTVKHRSRVRKNPDQPNLRQIHLIHSELHDELRRSGFQISAGEMGENLTTEGVDLLGLPAGTLLRIGDNAVVRITGLRNPCSQLDELQPGLMNAVLERAEDGTLIRKAGVMGVVVADGVVRTGDPIVVTLPPPPHEALVPV